MAMIFKQINKSHFCLILSCQGPMFSANCPTSVPCGDTLKLYGGAKSCKQSLSKNV